MKNVNNDSSLISSFFLHVLDFLGKFEIFTNKSGLLSLISLKIFRYFNSDSSSKSPSQFKYSIELILSNNVCASISSSSLKFAESSQRSFTNACIFDNTFCSKAITSFDSSVGKKL